MQYTAEKCSIVYFRAEQSGTEEISRALRITQQSCVEERRGEKRREEKKRGEESSCEGAL